MLANLIPALQNLVVSESPIDADTRYFFDPIITNSGSPGAGTVLVDQASFVGDADPVNYHANTWVNPNCITWEAASSGGYRVPTLEGVDVTFGDGAFTAALWFKSTSRAGISDIFGKNSIADNDPGWAFQRYNGTTCRLRLEAANGVAVGVDLSNVFDGTDSVKFIWFSCDGAGNYVFREESTDTETTHTIATAANRILKDGGELTFGSMNASPPIVSRIGAAQIWNKLQTKPFMAAHYAKWNPTYGAF